MAHDATHYALYYTRRELRRMIADAENRCARAETVEQALADMHAIDQMRLALPRCVGENVSFLSVPVQGEA